MAADYEVYNSDGSVRLERTANGISILVDGVYSTASLTLSKKDFNEFAQGVLEMQKLSRKKEARQSRASSSSL